MRQTMWHSGGKITTIRNAGFSAVLAAIACIAVPALAEEPPLDADYGNKDGCIYANTGETNGSDDFFMMNKEAITTAASFCEFKSIDGKTADGFKATVSCDGFKATVSCQDEGMESATDFKLAINRSGKDSYTIKFDDGTIWGPLKRCK